MFDFDVVVIGGGTAGLVSAFVADALKARVALVEQDKIGGECLWRGCVPSKTLIRSAKVMEMVGRSEEFGVHLEKPRVVWNAVRLRIQDAQDDIKKLEREELAKSNVEMLRGHARFLDPHTIELSSGAATRRISASKFIIATGSNAVVPDVDGLEDVGYLAPHDLFSLPSLPRSLVFLGGGPIACEMAQAMQRLGSKCTIIQRDEQLLPREEPDVSRKLEALLRAEGVTVHLHSSATRIESGEKKTVIFQTPDGEQSASGSQIVLATGKKPDVEKLSLEAAGVELKDGAVKVNDALQTSAAHIWACGDVLGRYLFTHVAEHEGKVAGANAVLPPLVARKIDYNGLVWVTFTDPEVAHIGMTSAEAKDKWGDAKTWDVPYNRVDRAIIEGETAGFARIVTSPSGRVVGGHIIGPHAGETVAALVGAVRGGALLTEFADAMFPYPTLSEVLHKAGNQAYEEALEGKWVQKGLEWLHGGARDS